MGAEAKVHVNVVETSLLKIVVRQKKIITAKENGEHSQELILCEHYRHHRRRVN